MCSGVVKQGHTKTRNFPSGLVGNMYCCPTQVKGNCFWSSLCRDRGAICQNYGCVSATVLKIKFELPAVRVVITFRIQLFCMNSCMAFVSQIVVLNEYLAGIATLASCNSLIILQECNILFGRSAPGVYVWTFLIQYYPTIPPVMASLWGFVSW